MLDTLVTHGIVFGDLAVRHHLDDWSQQALAPSPDLPTLQGSRGAALVECGRCEEGKALLVPLAAPDQAVQATTAMASRLLAVMQLGAD